MKTYLSVPMAVVVSAVLWLFGTGLHPYPGLVVLAPVPVLLIASRVPGRIAFAAALVSWLGGAVPFVLYFSGTLEQPWLPTILLLGITATTYASLILLTGTLIRHGRPGAAVLALPAGWVLMEFLLAAIGPFGAWWSLAYTQAEVLPLIQIAAVTGRLGIVFVILLVPAAIAVLIDPHVPRRMRIRCASGTCAVMVAVVGYGLWQLSAPAERGSVAVALVAVSQPEDFVPVDTVEGRDMVVRVVAEVERLTDRGARVVVLPEKAWRAEESTLSDLAVPLTEVARRRGVNIIAGLVLTRGETSVSAAIDFPSGLVYAKNHLVAGWEDELTEGTERAVLPGTGWAMAVCFDLDFPDLVRANRNQGASLLLVPALDFRVDRWLHSRMAVLRGVESGVSVARSPQMGDLVLSDDWGRILATASADVTRTVSVLAIVPEPTHPTVYARFGEWFVAVAILLLAHVVLSAVRSRAGLRASAGRRRAQPGIRTGGMTHIIDRGCRKVSGIGVQ
ncbi:nitrilase-related carbon-nitrogen hydrolase [Nocardia jejuensis]|uniref:nitrilase-related carbon-nitrogen hydrolase n=1 Tax=Nocardia jejuensis TaxID=328049 RepID=UPI0014726A97|nr:nitrilase-related carbon-nitrogen hydrolase [Nocardia jejuensis]